MAKTLTLRDTNPDSFVGPLLLPLPGTLDEVKADSSPSLLLLRATYFDMRNRLGFLLEDLRRRIDTGVQLPREASLSTTNILNSPPLLRHFVENTSPGFNRSDAFAFTPYIYSWRNGVKSSIAVCDQLSQIAIRIAQIEFQLEESGAVVPSAPINCPWSNIFTMETIFSKSWKTEAASMIYNAFMLTLQDAFLELHIHRMSDSVISEKITDKQFVELALSSVVTVARQYLENIMDQWESLNFSWLVAQGFIPTRDYLWSTYSDLLALMQLDYEVLRVLLPLFPDANTFETTLAVLSYNKEKRPATPALPDIRLDNRKSDGSQDSFDELVKKAETVVNELNIDIPSKDELVAKEAAQPAVADDLNLFTNLTMCYNKTLTAKNLALKLLGNCFVRVNHFEEAEPTALPLDYKDFYDTLRCREPQTFFVSKYINQASVIFQLIQLVLERVMISDTESVKPLRASIDRFFDSPKVILCFAGTRQNETIRHIQLHRANAQQSSSMKTAKGNHRNPALCNVFPADITACDIAFDVWTMQMVAQMPPSLLVGIERLIEATSMKTSAIFCNNKDWQKRPEFYRPVVITSFKPPVEFANRTAASSTFCDRLEELIKGAT